MEALADFDKVRYSYPHYMTDEQWSNIIKTMIDGFKATLKIHETYDNEEYERLKKTQDKGLKLFVKYFNDLWD